MQEARRKLAVLGGPPELLGQLAAALGPTFEVVEAKPGTTISEATPEVAILTVDPEAFGVSGATGASLWSEGWKPNQYNLTRQTADTAALLLPPLRFGF